MRLVRWAHAGSVEACGCAIGARLLGEETVRARVMTSGRPCTSVYRRG
jgi:hypothetical protein